MTTENVELVVRSRRVNAGHAQVEDVYVTIGGKRVEGLRFVSVQSEWSGLDINRTTLVVNWPVRTEYVE